MNLPSHSLALALARLHAADQLMDNLPLSGTKNSEDRLNALHQSCDTQFATLT
ncbi:hypothetical protein TWF481_010293 [Arthrobotrys musiformis]|uniref:Uncharacterized protein n=1 Tax=Arthrobotrys musiformis TaxID=47236 RepID=A0AAV9W0K0_9PEZI